MSTQTVGFDVLARHGSLGVVVDVEHDAGASDPTALVVRGGVSDLLTYHVPAALVSRISPERRSVFLDVDLADFVPSLNPDGTVELRPRGD